MVLGLLEIVVMPDVLRPWPTKIRNTRSCIRPAILLAANTIRGRLTATPDHGGIMIKHLTITVTAAVLVLVCTAPFAHAETSMTAAEICNEAAPGTTPKVNPFTHSTACSNALVPGLFMAAPSVQNWMANNYVGSYPVDPNNPFSDWTVPDGARKAPPPDPSFRWRADLTEDWKVCPPTCPSY